MEKKITLSKNDRLQLKSNCRAICEKLYVRAKVKVALKDERKGKVISHEQLKKELTEW